MKTFEVRVDDEWCIEFLKIEVCFLLLILWLTAGKKEYSSFSRLTDEWKMAEERERDGGTEDFLRSLQMGRERRRENWARIDHYLLETCERPDFEENLAHEVTEIDGRWSVQIG